MKIRIKMHSVLDDRLKPDFALIRQAAEEMVAENICTREKLHPIIEKVEKIDALTAQESEITKLIKESSAETKMAYQAQKKAIIAEIDNTLEDALTLIAEAGGGSKVKYNYDLHFNRIVAGLMGSTCYMKETFEELEKKGIRNILAIAKTVENNDHHSTFGHSHLTLEITGIPKALAMILNNEKEYNTSEKSGRYTVMDELDEAESNMFYKWKDLLKSEIFKKYASKTSFFDEKGVKIDKIAQENSRYMVSVFTPSNMVYTTSFRQLNYITHWFENILSSNQTNNFYAPLLPYMQEFVDFVKSNNLYSEKLEDGKNRGLTMFGAPSLKEYISGQVYSINYKTSLACLGQLQRHRTINYHIADENVGGDLILPNGEVNMNAMFIPPILKSDKALTLLWAKDMASLSDHIPQGTYVSVVENGETADFLIKACERVCVLAQKEIRDLTQHYCGKFANALNEEIATINDCYDISKPQYARIANRDAALAKQFEKMSQSARCTAGYKCPSPCHFGEGVSLESDV